jgi:uncharacterized membrane protein
MVSKVKKRTDFLERIKDMSLNRRIALVVFIIFIFIFFSFAIIFTYRLPEGYSFGVLDVLATYHMELMFLMMALGVAVGAFAVYALYEKIEIKQQESGITAETLLNFMGGEERRIIMFVVKNGGTAYQSEIGRLEGFSRLRAHRALAKLAEKKIVSLERVGKVNKVMLQPALQSALSQKKVQEEIAAKEALDKIG